MLFSKRKITVIPGDGIGPEVVSAALKVIEATGVEVEPEVCLAGAKAFEKGIESGVPDETRESIERVRPVHDEKIRRVEMLEGVEGDRQRSLQQELAEIAPGAIGDFHGGEQVLQEARDMAAQQSSLGPAVAFQST